MAIFAKKQKKTKRKSLEKCGRDNIQKQIVDAKKEYDRTWDGVFVPMGDEGTSQRKEYERRGKLFKAASKKYKDLLKKHKVATFK